LIIAALTLAQLAGLWAGFNGALAVSASSRGMARNADVGTGTRYDVDTTPTAGLSLSWGKSFGATVGYSAQVTMRDASDADNSRATVLMHSASAGLHMSGPDYQLALNQSVAWGTLTFATLRLTPPMAGGPAPLPSSNVDFLPPTRTTRVFNETTGATFGYDWDKRWRTILGASYGISGGRDPMAQAVLPRQKMATVSLGADYLLTHRDHLAFTPTFVDTHVSTGSEYMTLTAPISWRRIFSPTSSARLELGPQGVRSLEPGLTPRYTVLVTGTVAATNDLYKRRNLVVSSALAAGLAPSVNGLNGSYQQRAQGSGILSALFYKFTVSVGGDAAQTLPVSDKRAVRLLGFSANASYSPFEYFDINMGFRQAWQTSHDMPVGAASHLWTAFVGVGVRAPALRF
jgi:hypothetical protein